MDQRAEPKPYGSGQRPPSDAGVIKAAFIVEKEIDTQAGSM